MLCKCNLSQTCISTFHQRTCKFRESNVPTLVDDKVKFLIPDKIYSVNSNVLPKAINQSINNDNSENVEVSDITEITEPVVNFHFNNDPITFSNESGYRTRSGRISKPPVKLNLQVYVFSFYKGRSVLYLSCII